VLAGDGFFVVVGDGRAIVDTTEAVHSAGVEQQRGEELCFAGARVTDKGDVSEGLRVIDLHGRVPSLAPARRLRAPGAPM
jgi:hypothetical protein